LAKHVDFEALAASIDAAAPGPSRVNMDKRYRLVRCMGIVRVTFALYLKAASYNLGTGPEQPRTR